MNLLRSCFLSLGFSLLIYPQPVERSGIEGFVTTDLTAAISGAKIGVDSVVKGLHRETDTNASGYYVVLDLSPGAYSVWAEVKGLGCIVYPHVAVFPGQRVRQDFTFVRTRRLPGGCEHPEKSTK